MDYLQKSILKTVAYWDALDWPLTSFEAWRYLVNPRRLGLHTQNRYAPGEIRDALESKELSKYITSTYGFYYFRDRGPEIVKNRIDRELLADQKWRKMLRRIRWFQMIPYVRLIMGSGSIAAGNVSDHSDWDLLIVAKHNRIWTCRAFLWFLASAFGWYRRDDAHTKDKFCLNHFITERSLLINLPSLYTAQLYGHLVPIWGDWTLYRSFQERNSWIRSYLAHWPIPFIPHAKSARRSPIANSIRKAGEAVLNTRLGERLEKILGNIQTRKIAQNPKTGAPGGRVSYSPESLEFHPDSKERLILNRLNERLAALGFPELADEKDSGLTS